MLNKKPYLERETYVSTKLNRAEFVSRGCNVEELKQDPAFLLQDEPC